MGCAADFFFPHLGVIEQATYEPLGPLIVT
jgi:hypothetical protein